MVEHVLAKDETGVRFSLVAQKGAKRLLILLYILFRLFRDIIGLCARGEMDITAVFGTVILGSSPGGRAKA